MYQVMKEAVDRARNGGGPTLVEAITYRLAGHSTSDDPTRYQPGEEISHWNDLDPLKRFQSFLINQGLLDENKQAALIASVEEEISSQVKIAFDLPAREPVELFENVFQELIPRLKKQKEAFKLETLS